MIYFLLVLGFIFLFMPQLIFKLIGLFKRDYKITQASLLLVRLIGFVIILIILGLYLYNSIF